MAGNVLEWTLEAYNTNTRVYRGGSYNRDGSNFTASGRSASIPNNTGDLIGFRVALYL